MKKTIFAALLAGAALCVLGAQNARGEEKFFEIRAKRFSYTPSIILVKQGDLVRIRLVSEDVTHGLYVDGYGLNTSAHPGQDGTLKFVADKTGRFIFRCSVTCGEFHPYMIGHLKVAPNKPFMAYALVLLILGTGGLAIILMVRRKEAQNG